MREGSYEEGSPAAYRVTSYLKSNIFLFARAEKKCKVFCGIDSLERIIFEIHSLDRMKYGCIGDAHFARRYILLFHRVIGWRI